MHQHLMLIKTVQTRSKVAEEENIPVSEMEIILTQALLMGAGSAIFKAIKSGEIADILAGLVALAYTALQALAMQDEDIVEHQGATCQTYQLLTIMRLLSDKIQNCSSGQAKHYSELYHLCTQLASGFLNADFDKAFRVYHDWFKARADFSEETTIMSSPQKIKPPDLTDCLYE
jgi:hypothetical protein